MEIEKILKNVDENGEITYEKLNELLPEGHISAHNFEELLTQLEAHGIKVIEGYTTKKIPKIEKREKVDDPTHIYLRELGSTPMLTRDEEIKIAKEIENKYILLTTLVCSTFLGINQFMKYVKKIKNKKMSIEEFLRIDIPGPSNQGLEKYKRKLSKTYEYVKEKMDEIAKMRYQKKYIDYIKRRRRAIKNEIAKLNLQFPIIEEIASKIKNFYEKNMQKRKKLRWEDKEAQIKYYSNQIEEKIGMKKSNFEKLLHKIEEVQKSIEKKIQIMVSSNIRLVISIVKRYINRGLEFIDLVQEGNSGLVKAATRYDYRKGYRFATYASWWIRQSVLKALAEQSRTIKVPFHTIEILHKVLRESRVYMQEHQKEPTPEEISERLDIPIKKIKAAFSFTQSISSLDSPVGDDRNTFLYDFIPGGRENSPSYSIAKAKLKEKFQEVLRELSQKEQRILRLRFGLDGNPPKTLEEIGLIFGITRERVRQLENKAIKKLKYKERRKKLEPLIELLK